MPKKTSKKTTTTWTKLAALPAALSTTDKATLWNQHTRAFVTNLIESGLVPAKTKRGTSTIVLADSVSLAVQLILGATAR